ncbi:MAG: glycoside hydrolase xylanase [Bacteroidales bacterium]|nr:glycoside hydrolase xylanase [Bacteroidales bacterium]MDE6536867.1 PCMD domain-containing protein [Muribaculaceae bacterium]
MYFSKIFKGVFSTILLSSSLLATTSPALALRLEPIKFGDFSQWVTRHINESKVIGGKTKTVYAIGPTRTIEGNTPYSPQGGSPWGSSNVYAKVSGIVKGSNSVSPATINGNKVAKLETKMEEVKVLGLINMDVMVAGSIYLGRLFEPVTSTKGPFAKIEMGIPYTKRPKALVFDYKVDVPPVNTRVKATGFGGKKTLQGRDNAEVYVLLQKRWEDEKGNIYAHRVGTGRERYSKSVPWTKGHELKIQYGDITKTPGYKPWMGLLDGEKAYYARNSKGKMVKVHEVGWAAPDETPTHVLVMASSTCGEPFVGTEGMTLYIDNISFGF